MGLSKLYATSTTLCLKGADCVPEHENVVGWTLRPLDEDLQRWYLLLALIITIGLRSWETPSHEKNKVLIG
jgi:hypothetical protein